MLPKQKRLNKDLFLEIMASGRTFHAAFFSVKAIKTDTTLSPSRIGISASKKIFKTAVERNKVRRRLYSVVKELIPEFSGSFSMIIMAKEPCLTEKLPELRVTLRSLFVKSTIIK